MLMKTEVTFENRKLEEDKGLWDNFFYWTRNVNDLLVRQHKVTKNKEASRIIIVSTRVKS